MDDQVRQILAPRRRHAASKDEARTHPHLWIRRERYGAVWEDFV